MDNRQGRLEMISAAFSRAVDVGFVTAVLRPHEHLVSFLRYYNPKERESLSNSISLGHPKRALPIDREAADDKAPPIYTDVVLPREESGGPGAFHSHDYRRSEDGVVRSSPFQRCDLTFDAQGGDKGSFPIHDYKRSTEATRSSTHSTSGEHLKARESNDYPPRQPPVHNPQ
ncbi:hypothetical protein FRC10_011287 [Ceratobasidium sp. 414]|nr:hypothetical protein FRC10_011287 [Ceratobasidium sp. 414]